MSEAMERAHETMHSSHGGGHEEAHGGVPTWTKSVAILIAMLAAVLALIQVGEKGSHSEYLTSHISLTNDWAFYQAKNARAVIRGSEANVLEALPNATDPAMQARISDAKAYVARMRDDPKDGDGMKQLAEKAHAQEHKRDEAFHRYHGYEYASGAVEIAIVLASVSVVTAIRAFAVVAGALGIGASLFAISVAAHLL